MTNEQLFEKKLLRGLLESLGPDFHVKCNSFEQNKPHYCFSQNIVPRADFNSYRQRTWSVAIFGSHSAYSAIKNNAFTKEGRKMTDRDIAKWVVPFCSNRLSLSLFPLSGLIKPERTNSLMRQVNSPSPPSYLKRTAGYIVAYLIIKWAIVC